MEELAAVCDGALRAAIASDVRTITPTGIAASVPSGSPLPTWTRQWRVSLVPGQRAVPLPGTGPPGPLLPPPRSAPPAPVLVPAVQDAQLIVPPGPEALASLSKQQLLWLCDRHGAARSQGRGVAKRNFNMAELVASLKGRGIADLVPGALLMPWVIGGRAYSRSWVYAALPLPLPRHGFVKNRGRRMMAVWMPSWSHLHPQHHGRVCVVQMPPFDQNCKSLRHTWRRHPRPYRQLLAVSSWRQPFMCV